MDWLWIFLGIFLLTFFIDSVPFFLVLKTIFYWFFYFFTVYLLVKFFTFSFYLSFCILLFKSLMLSIKFLWSFKGIVVILFFVISYFWLAYYYLFFLNLKLKKFLSVLFEVGLEKFFQSIDKFFLWRILLTQRSIGPF